MNKRNNTSEIFKNSNLDKRTYLILGIIFLVGISIRFIFIPYDIPLTLDSFSGYFLYALDISILGHLPNYTLSQSGWSEFLALFFILFHSDHLIDYMNLQRMISVIISGITIIPIFFICKKFFNKNYALIGALIFAFDPRIILNSILGISEPLYILAISCGILLFLNSNKIFNYSSFGFFAWVTIIRPEGLFWFVSFSIIYVLRFRNKRRDLMMYLACLGVFIIVLSPIVIHRIQCCDDDAIIGRIIGELANYENNLSYGTGLQSQENHYGPNFENGIKLIGWFMIPVFIIFVPIGIIQILRNLKYPEYLLLIASAVLSLPIIYSVSIAPDTRYIFPLIPIFCVITLFGINYVLGKFNREKIIYLIISLIILNSFVFLTNEELNYDEKKATYEISKVIINDIKGVNKGSNAVEYFKNIEIENRWPIFEYSGGLRESYEIKKFSPSGFSNLPEFIEYNKQYGLTHIIVDKNENLPKFLRDVFDNEDNYPYLIKDYDSSGQNGNYIVKRLIIDYNIFEQINKNLK